MRAAFAQAHEYAINLPEGRPPFVVTCDIGHIFEVWAGFSGSYGGYGASRRIPFAELTRPEVRAFFHTLFTNPHSLNPALHAAKVTREVAEHLATLEGLGALTSYGTGPARRWSATRAAAD